MRNRLPADRHAFAAGDFNTTSTETQQHDMLERYVRPHWTVVHDYCQDCPGTYYYAPDDNWSFLDMILFSPARGEKATWQVRADSVQILNQMAAQATAEGAPNRYRSASRSGVSDHWPLLVAIELTEKQ